VIDALAKKDAERQALTRELAALEQPDPTAVLLDPRAVRRELRAYLDDWRALASGNVAETRGLLETVLRDRIVWRPTTFKGAAAYELKMPIAFDRLLTTIVPGLQVGSTSPMGVEERRQWQPATFLVGVAAQVVGQSGGSGSV
jgi:hypothetical protein